MIDEQEGRPSHIYLLIDGNEKTFYVGRSVNPQKRFGGHRLDSQDPRYNHQWKYEWMNNQANGSLDEMTMEIVEEGVPPDINAEDRWIRKLICEGHPLQNMRAGSAWCDLTYAEFMEWRRANKQPDATYEEWQKWRKDILRRKEKMRAEDAIKLPKERLAEVIRVCSTVLTDGYSRIEHGEDVEDVVDDCVSHLEQKLNPLKDEYNAFMNWRKTHVQENL